MNKKSLLKLLFCATFILALAIANSASGQECVQYCGNPPDGIGGGGGGGGGSSDDDWIQYIGDDADGDGRDDVNDNCPWVPNRDQADADGDSVGDLCDNCPSVANADQTDSDRNGQGNACTTDDDGDGVVDGSDNCPTVANADQADWDTDGAGNACDGYCKGNTTDSRCAEDTDGDTVPDNMDNCPTVADAGNIDSDSDGLGNACDDDADNDSIVNSIDNCPLVYNPDQTDADKDGKGDSDNPDLSCDDNLCYVVQRDENGVLDPNQPCIDPSDGFTIFAVYRIEDNKAFIWPATNRADEPLNITVTLEGFPGSSAPVITPLTGFTTASTTNYYQFVSDFVTIAGLEAGTYTLRMDATLISDGSKSSDTISFNVADSGGGCSINTNSKPNLALFGAVLLIAGMIIVLRVRKRQ
jgi:hypothetical protein